MMNQRVFNISGLFTPRFSLGGTANSHIGYTASRFQGVFKLHSFPDNTTGVFYYRQSDTSPMRLGELRFRLCSDVRTFDMGSDLILPSGQPWFISTHSLHISREYKSIRERLVEEGLLEHDLYPGVPDSILTLGIAPLTSLRQPFVVDLSAASFKLKLVTPNPQVVSVEHSLRSTFRKAVFDKALFSGKSLYVS
jgi:hypothetical protein